MKFSGERQSSWGLGWKHRETCRTAAPSPGPISDVLSGIWFYNKRGQISRYKSCSYKVGPSLIIRPDGPLKSLPVVYKIHTVLPDTIDLTPHLGSQRLSDIIQLNMSSTYHHKFSNWLLSYWTWRLVFLNLSKIKILSRSKTKFLSPHICSVVFFLLAAFLTGVLDCFPQQQVICVWRGLVLNIRAITNSMVTWSLSQSVQKC